MSAPTVPRGTVGNERVHGPLLVRFKTRRGWSLFLTNEIPNIDHGRIKFRGARVRLDDERLGAQPRAYVLAGRTDEWFDLGSHGAIVTTPRLAVPWAFGRSGSPEPLRSARTAGVQRSSASGSRELEARRAA